MVPLPAARGIDNDARSSSPTSCRPPTFGAINGNIRPGDTVAIFGCGPVGLCAVMSAKLFGPTETLAVNSIPYRLELRTQLGATPLNVENAREQIFESPQAAAPT